MIVNFPNKSRIIGNPDLEIVKVPKKKEIKQYTESDNKLFFKPILLIVPE